MFNSEHEMPMAIVSEKEYNAEVRKQKREQVREVHNASGSATMVITDMANDMMKMIVRNRMKLKLTDKSNLFN